MFPLSESEGDPSSEDEYIAEESKSKSRIGKVCILEAAFFWRTLTPWSLNYSEQLVASPPHQNPILRCPMTTVGPGSRSLRLQILAALSVKVTSHLIHLLQRGKSLLNRVRPMILLGNIA